MRLKNKVAIITGGAGGIGLETAKLFLNEGAKGVLLVDLDEEMLKDAAKGLDSDNVSFFSADVSKSDEVKAYTEKKKKKRN